MGNIRYGFTRPENYDFDFEKRFLERYGSRIPDKVFDAHFHLYPKMMPKVPEDEVFTTWRKCTNELLCGDKIKGGLIMADPIEREDRDEETEVLRVQQAFGAKCATENDGFYYGHVIRPWENPKDVEDWIERTPKLAVLKPYRCYADVPDTFEANILTYAPEWMWEIADHYGKCMLIHLSHYKDALCDPGNGEELRYLSKKYPNAKINLAHCAMGHNPEKLKWGLHYLDDLENVYTDIGGIGEALSMIYLIRKLGLKKVMFATDGYGYGFGEQSRCFAVGGGFLALENGVFKNYEMPPDYAFNIVPPALETLVATFAAADVLGLTKAELEDIFYNNAYEMYSSCCQKSKRRICVIKKASSAKKAAVFP